MRVFRERGALLSRLAHDVEFKLARFELSEDSPSVEVSFDAASLEVQGAWVDGQLDPSVLDAQKRAEIERNVRRDVLKVSRYPRGIFSGRFHREAERVLVAGTLELLAKQHPVAFTLEPSSTGYTGTLSIQPSDWGIAPYRALMGALKLQDRVEIQVVASA